MRRRCAISGGSTTWSSSYTASGHTTGRRWTGTTATTQPSPPTQTPTRTPDPNPTATPPPYSSRYVGLARANAAEILGAHFGGAGRCEVDFAHCEWHSALHKGVGLDALYGQISTDAHRPFRLRHTLVPVVLDFYAFLTPQLRQLVLDEV